MNESNNKTDNEIIKLIRSAKVSDQDRAFTSLYEAHFATVRGMVKKNSGNDIEAEDVFQDTLIVLHSNLRKESFALTCKLGTYIYSVARNLWLNQLRKSAKATKMDVTEFEFIDVAESSLEVLQREEANSLLNDLIMKLGENCQNVLKYFYFERMKLKTIATELGYANESVAKTKKSKCLRQLRELLVNEPHLKTMLWTS